MKSQTPKTAYKVSMFMPKVSRKIFVSFFQNGDLFLRTLASNTRYVGLSLLIFFLAVFCGFAEEEPSSTLKAAETKIYLLSLHETTRIALANNFDIQLIKYDAWIARTKNKTAQSIYDTVFESEATYRNNQRQQTSTILGTKVVDNEYAMGLSKKLPTGTKLAVDLDNQRSYSNSVFSTSSLAHDSTLGMTVEQDLGKNFFGIQDRGVVKMTKLEVENAEYTTLDKIEESIASVQKAYWDLVLQLEMAHIEEDMVDQARKLYELHQEKLKTGLVEKPEAAASQANYLNRQNALTLRRHQVQTKINVLKLYLNITDDDINIKPTVQLLSPSIDINLEDSLRQAFEYRRDYKWTRNEIQAKEIQLSMKKNNVWPEINLSASLERNGLGDHFKQAVTNITDEDNPHFLAQLRVSIPLENSEARGQLQAAELENAKTLIQLKYIERKIAIGIIDQVRQCRVLGEVALSQEEISNLQAQKLEEEEKRFLQGRSDTDTMIRFQEDVLSSKDAAANAKHRYLTALIDLRQEMGTLLDTYWDGKL
ncbi:MAG TPA: hypothetical protein DD723_08605 [Candidatus Omnitrophica bacterium]|nr:hypothetical protein [Candidatus Omnitrophota bacterium]